MGHRPSWEAGGECHHVSVPYLAVSVTCSWAYVSFTPTPLHYFPLLSVSISHESFFLPSPSPSSLPPPPPRYQTVASRASPAVLWAGPCPLRVSGHGKPASRFGVDTSVGGLSSLTAGSYRLPTASRRGERTPQGLGEGGGHREGPWEVQRAQTVLRGKGREHLGGAAM